MNFISNAMGWVLAQLSGLFGHNFAASVFVFTILVNVIMLPLTLKSQKSTAKQAKLKPKLDALKKKYGNDKQKYSQAMSELYTKEGVSMSGGCLPMFIRLFVMLGVYWAVVSPFTYVLDVNTTALDSAKQWTSYVKVVNSNSITDAEWTALGIESIKAEPGVIARAEELGETVENYAKIEAVSRTNSLPKENVKADSLEDKVRKAVSQNAVVREIEIADYTLKGKPHYSPTVEFIYTSNGGDLSEIEKISFNLLGIDLAESPNFSWNFSNFEKIWIIPILSFATAMLSSIVSLAIQKKVNPDAPSMATMMLIMPLFSLYIAFTVPGAVGFYWACSNVVSGGLQAATQLLYGPSVVIAKEQSKSIIDRAAKEKARIDRVNAEQE